MKKLKNNEIDLISYLIQDRILELKKTLKLIDCKEYKTAIKNYKKILKKLKAV